MLLCTSDTHMSAESSPVQSAGVDRVFDADFHVTEGEQIIEKYLPEPWDRLVGHTFPDERLQPFYPNQDNMPSSFESGMISHEHHNLDRDVVTREAVRDGMAEMDLDGVLIAPGKNINLSCVPNDDFATALATAYNDWILTEIADPSDGIYSPLIVAPQRPHLAADEIDDRAGEEAFKAVMIPSGGVNPPLGDQQYWDIYEAAERHGLPIVMQSAAGNAQNHIPKMFQGMTYSMELHAITNPIVNMNHFVSLLLQGVPAKFDLDVVFQESSLGWVPFMMRRVDHEHIGMEEDAPLLEQLPSEYVEDSFYFASQPLEGTGNPEYVERLLELIDAEERLLFSTDYPHYDPDDIAAVVDLLSDLYGSETIANIMGGTARDLFDLN